jgi:hypothetical protein
MLILIDLVLLALAGLASMLLLRRARAWRRRARAQAEDAVDAAGLQASGDMLGIFEARSGEGVSVALTNGAAHTRPGDSAPTPDLCVARIAVPLADQIVCKASEADRILGALPAVPRLRTGYSPFDDAYAVFVGTSGGRTAGSYRAAVMEGDTPWAQAPVLDGFLDLDLRWMRVHEGVADIVFPVLAIEDVVRATRLALAVERAAIGKPVPPLAPGPRAIRQGWWEAGKKLASIWAFSVFWGGLLGGLPFASRGRIPIDGWLLGVVLAAIVLLGIVAWRWSERRAQPS